MNTVAYPGLNSESNDILDMEVNIWNLTTQAGSPLGSGTYSVTPGLVPEPSALTLLTTGVVLVALRWRHWRRHAERVSAAFVGRRHPPDKLLGCSVSGQRSRRSMDSDLSTLRSHAAATFPRHRTRAKGGGRVSGGRIEQPPWDF